MFLNCDDAIKSGKPPFAPSRGSRCAAIRGRATAVHIGAMALVIVAYLASFSLPAYEWEGHRYVGWDAFKNGFEVVPFLIREGSNWFAR